MMNLDSILSETLDAGTKGYPLSSPALKISDIGAQRWSLLAGDLPLPLAVIRDSAIAQAHRASRAGRTGRPHRHEDLRRGARRSACRRSEQGRLAVRSRML